MFRLTTATTCACERRQPEQARGLPTINSLFPARLVNSKTLEPGHEDNFNDLKMSGRLLSSRLAAVARQASLRASQTPRYHTSQRAGGLLQASGLSRWQIRRPWPLRNYGIHNVPAVRHASFARIIPSLAMKLFRIPAMMGTIAIGGLAYIQYQATQAGNWALDVFGRAKDTVSGGANTVLGGAGDVFGRIGTGWDETRSKVGMPQWMRTLFETGEEPGTGGQGGPAGSGGGPERKEAGVGAAGAAAATTAAFALDKDGEEDTRTESEAARDDQMMVLTRKMIEIRSLLQTVGQSENLTLPSIVVVGSQSSGKSSVLEAIVGHEFLPKGSNMVTRRPIELTLVNTPDAHAEYGEFPALGLGKITDFTQIQRTLTDLNLAVPDSECVSDDPIQLRISSPNVPDLSLTDLPGYIQVVGHDQPPELKQKISDLCDKYIQAPNIILAISAADVDLANSTSLRASRRIDPRGERTIGVVTKMDLVDPIRGAAILSDKQYPLRLGYVGVVCKIPQQNNSLFSRGSANITSLITRNESAYFSSHPETFSPEAGLVVGTPNLRKKLMTVLETTMSASLATTAEAIHQELAEASYEFKVQYNERPLSADSYLAESLDAFKHSFKSFSDSFGRREVREILKHELDQQVLNLLAQRYWNRPVEDLSPLDGPGVVDILTSLPKADPADTLWNLKLDASTASLTKLGIGRLASTVVAENLALQIEQLIANSTFSTHPFAHTAITQASSSILRELSYDTSDELEICVKPYKYRIDLDDAEWSRGRDNITATLKTEMKDCEAAMQNVEQDMGGKRRFKDVVAFIDRVQKGEVVLEGSSGGGAGGFSAALLAKGISADRAISDHKFFP